MEYIQVTKENIENEHMENKNSILDKAIFLLEIAKRGACSEEEHERVIEMTKEQSDNLRLGRVFGYSIGEYAIATLKWISDDLNFEKAFKTINQFQQLNVNDLIESKLYMQI